MRENRFSGYWTYFRLVPGNMDIVHGNKHDIDMWIDTMQGILNIGLIFPQGAHDVAASDYMHCIGSYFTGRDTSR